MPIHTPKGSKGTMPGGAPASGVAGPNIPTGKPIKLPKYY